MIDYDVIVVGAGSIGVPIALAMGEKGIKTGVLDWRASPGQGQNKHAIGGIRATHSDPAKILTCMRSLEIFSTWQDRYGDDIEWLKGGYTFPCLPENRGRRPEIHSADTETLRHECRFLRAGKDDGGGSRPQSGRAHRRHGFSGRRFGIAPAGHQCLLPACRVPGGDLSLQGKSHPDHGRRGKGYRRGHGKLPSTRPLWWWMRPDRGHGSFARALMWICP